MGTLKSFVRQYKLFLQSVVLIAAFFGFDGWESLKAIGSALGAHISISTTILSWGWWAEDVFKVPFARIFLVIVVAGTIFNVVFTIRHRNRPITVLCTDVRLEFFKGGAEVNYYRRQIIHANRPGISAYFLNLGFDGPNGKAKPDSSGNEFEAWIEHPKNFRVKPRVTKTGRGRDIDLMYSEPLPYSWRLSILPRWLLEWGPQKLPRWIDKYLVVQHLRYVALNEYDGEYTKFSARSTRYSHQRMTLTLDFSRDTGPRPHSESEIAVLRRLANAVLEETAAKTESEHVYSINISEGLARDETLVVTWTRH